MDEVIKNVCDDHVSRREGSKFGMMFIQKVIDTVGVKSWEDLQGKNVRVKSSHTEVTSIGHILEDKWFTPKKLASELSQ